MPRPVVAETVRGTVRRVAPSNNAELGGQRLEQHRDDIGDDDDPDERNEDEETLSDKGTSPSIPQRKISTKVCIEFLDDELIHGEPTCPPLQFRPLHNEHDDGDELRAIAQHYDEAAARDAARAVPRPQQWWAPAPRPASPIPVTPGTWIRYRGRLSFVVSARRLLQADGGE